MGKRSQFPCSRKRVLFQTALACSLVSVSSVARSSPAVVPSGQAAKDRFRGAYRSCTPDGKAIRPGDDPDKEALQHAIEALEIPEDKGHQRRIRNKLEKFKRPPHRPRRVKIELTPDIRIVFPRMGYDISVPDDGKHHTKRDWFGNGWVKVRFSFKLHGNIMTLEQEIMNLGKDVLGTWKQYSHLDDSGNMLIVNVRIESTQDGWSPLEYTLHYCRVHKRSGARP